jgi:hypothetical protein
MEIEPCVRKLLWQSDDSAPVITQGMSCGGAVSLCSIRFRGSVQRSFTSFPDTLSEISTNLQLITFTWCSPYEDKF